MTTFIAVQCFQCSTMQVKQQKKSSNKWNCVVCGEKQSLRKVFAQGSMAKDIRGFVQSFNMSRQFQQDHDNSSSSSSSSLVCTSTITTDQKKDDKKKRRSDWTEYMKDYDDHAQNDDEGKTGGGGDGELNPMIVTEMPKLLVASGSKFSNSNAQLTRLQKLAAKKIKICDEAVKSQETSNVWEQNQADRALKWNVLRAKIQQGSRNYSLVDTSQLAPGSVVSSWRDAGCENELLPKQLHEATFGKGLASKWSSFITEDDDYNELQTGRRFGCLKGADALESSLMNDDKVEDDIHPDFL